jgi:hypothetical protein
MPAGSGMAVALVAGVGGERRRRRRITRRRQGGGGRRRRRRMIRSREGCGAPALSGHGPAPSQASTVRPAPIAGRLSPSLCLLSSRRLVAPVVAPPGYAALLRRLVAPPRCAGHTTPPCCAALLRPASLHFLVLIVRRPHAPLRVPPAAAHAAQRRRANCAGARWRGRTQFGRRLRGPRIPRALGTANAVKPSSEAETRTDA